MERCNAIIGSCFLFVRTIMVSRYYDFWQRVKFVSLQSPRKYRFLCSMSRIELNMNVNLDVKNPPIVSLLAIEYLKLHKVGISTTEGNKTFLKTSDSTIEGDSSVGRYLARTFPLAKLYGVSALDASQVDSWLDFCTLHLRNSDHIDAALSEVNQCLAPSTHLVDHSFTLADFAVWATLSEKWSSLNTADNAHLKRWFDYCNDQAQFKAVFEKYPAKKTVVGSQTKEKNTKNVKEGLKATIEEGGKFFELPNAEKGKVVVRFPPEASGYLHIGHAKAALMNQYYKELYGGTLIMRFDDTNPAKENAHFEKIILDDIKKLQLTPDLYTRTSDYFDVMFKYAEQMIRQGDAFCDNTPADKMKEMREARLPSVNRDLSVEDNLRLFEEMKKGNDVGMTYCLRAKINFESDNGCLRDPVLYRCRDEEHLVHGNKYKAYPTYDFACPIVDSIEGVTHALRTSEYLDRDAQFYWIIDKLGIRKPYIYSYSRLALVNTVLSKRKLTYLVDEGFVDGWDDPRFPTVRGILRRGMTVQGLREFIVAQGSSKSNVHMEWDKIWSFNKKMIDPIAPRFTALLKSEAVPVTVHGATSSCVQYPKHPKNDSVGTKPVYYSSKVFVEGVDAKLMKVNDLVTFINWGNLRITNIQTHSDGHVESMEAKLELENKDFKKTAKVTWLAEHCDGEMLPTKCFFFDDIISKDLTKDDNFKDYINKDTKHVFDMMGDPCLAHLKKGDVIQLQRRGYFICDEAYQNASRHSGLEQPCVLLHVPDGSTTGMMNQNEKKAKGSGSSSRPKTETKSAKEKKVKQEAVVDVQLEEKLHKGVTSQGDKIRKLKSEKATKEVITAEVVILKELKEKYKTATGLEYSPQKAAMAPVTTPTESDSTVDVLTKKIAEQGDLVRKLKAEKKPKDVLQPSIDCLVKLKNDFMELTGADYKSPVEQNRPKERKKKKENAAPKDVAPKKTEDGKKQTRLCLEAKKNECLSDWYSQVITKAELIEYYDVSGCYILRPWSYGMWEIIRDFFNEKIIESGVENCYFPMFVSQAALQKEKDHIQDFAPEVAWVMKSGDSELAEPVAIRPTSETVMYPSYAKWIQSHRDLPLRLNQWCNVVRWEFKHPQPFLRTREFLWQEGHSAFALKKEACDEVYEILGYYEKVYTEMLAIPVVKGRKTEKEKFAGGEFTTTCEAYIKASGRAIQGATSHHLGQNFSKMFNIAIEDPSNPKEKLFVYQNSWGLTTRTIGVMVMVHGDDKGLVLPPRVAKLQVVIIPVGVTATTTSETRRKIVDSSEEYLRLLRKGGIRTKLDDRENYSPGWKYNDWELKGVPIRIELGPRDIEKNEFVTVRRDTGEKLSMKKEGCAKQISALLETIQSDMYARADNDLSNAIVVTQNWTDFNNSLEKGKLIQAPFCGDIKCEETIKKESAREETEDGAPSMGAKGLCIPFEQPAPITDQLCVHPACKKPALFYTMFGRSY